MLMADTAGTRRHTVAVSPTDDKYPAYRETFVVVY